jgi:hypothetical protein
MGGVKARLICLVRRHQWHNGWDEERRQTVWTCQRCGATKKSQETGTPAAWRRQPHDQGRGGSEPK